MVGDMKQLSIAFALAVSSLLAACGGGSNNSMVPHTITSSPTQPGASVAPAPTPTGAPAAPNSVLQTATINGSPTFITAAQLPVYTFGGDVPNVSNCTGSCLAIWPVVAPPAGTLPAPFSSFTRPDTGQMQLEFMGQPLYTFASDSALTATGDGFQNFHLLHPPAGSAPAATPTPVPMPIATPTPPPFTGY